MVACFGKTLIFDPSQLKQAELHEAYLCNVVSQMGFLGKLFELIRTAASHARDLLLSGVGSEMERQK